MFFCGWVCCMHACVACPMHGPRFGAWLGPSLGLWGHGPGALGARIQGWRPCLGTVGPGLPQHPWRLVPGQSGQAWNGSGSKAVPGILHTLLWDPPGLNLSAIFHFPPHDALTISLSHSLPFTLSLPPPMASPDLPSLTFTLPHPSHAHAAADPAASASLVACGRCLVTPGTRQTA